jgi:hypothetical protein
MHWIYFIVFTLHFVVVVVHTYHVTTKFNWTFWCYSLFECKICLLHTKQHGLRSFNRRVRHDTAPYLQLYIHIFTHMFSCFLSLYIHVWIFPFLWTYRATCWCLRSRFWFPFILNWERNKHGWPNHLLSIYDIVTSDHMLFLLKWRNEGSR